MFDSVHVRYDGDGVRVKLKTHEKVSHFKNFPMQQVECSLLENA